MATTPAVLVATPTIAAVVQSEVSALANKHIGLIFSLVGVIILLMGLMGVGGYFGLKAFDAQLSRQEVRDNQYQQDRTTFLNTLAAHDAERTADAAKIAQLEAQVKARDSKPLPKPVQDALQPKATVQQAIGGLAAAYGSTSALAQSQPSSDGQNLTVSVLGAQEAISAKVGMDLAQGDLGDQKSINALLKDANSSLSNDLGSCKAMNVQANKDIAGFKALAKRSRWQKFLAGAEKVGLLAGGMMLGHMI